MRDYLLVAQHKKRVDHHTRHGWLLRVHEGNGVVRLTAIGCDLALDELYLRVWDDDEGGGQ